jgi:hypothetical protein
MTEENIQENEENVDQDSDSAQEETPQEWAQGLILSKLAENVENGLSEQIISSIVYIYARQKFSDEEQIAVWKESKNIRSILNRLKRESVLRFSSNRWHIA